MHGRVGIIFLRVFLILGNLLTVKTLINLKKLKQKFNCLLCDDFGNSIPKVETHNTKEAK